MKILLRTAALATVAALAACTSPDSRPGPIDVTRFHLGTPIQPGTVSVETRTAYAGASPEDHVYIDAVAGELTRMGFGTGAGEQSEFIALVSYAHESHGTVRKRPPVTIGLGGGSFGGNVGVGAGANFGIGGGTAQVLGTRLMVQLKRRSDNTIVWEGNAQTEALSGTPAGQSAPMADRLARALFKGFPGESGITITVK